MTITKCSSIRFSLWPRKLWHWLWTGPVDRDGYQTYTEETVAVDDDPEVFMDLDGELVIRAGEVLVSLSRREVREAFDQLCWTESQQLKNGKEVDQEIPF